MATGKTLTVATTDSASPASAGSVSDSGASTPTSSAASSIHHDAAHTLGKGTSSAGSPLTQIVLLYHKATHTFLLRQLASAYSSSLEALELLVKTNRNHGLDRGEISTQRSYFILKQKLWILNITIFGAMLADRAEDEHQHGQQGRGLFRRRLRGSSKESPEKLVEDLWRRLVEDYGGLEGDVDGQVMVALVLLCANQKMYTLARQITEAYLATIPDGMMIHLETAAGALTSVERGNKDPLMTGYERLVELYVVHVLAKLNEWDSARQFVEYNTVLSDSAKKTYIKILDKLHQKSLRPKKTVAKKPVVSAPAPSSLSSSVSVSPASELSSASSDAENTPTATSGAVTTSQGINEQTNGSQEAASIKSTSARAGTVLPKSGPRSGSTAITASTLTLQGRIMLTLQHFVDQIKRASQSMGPSQMAVLFGIIALLGVLSRNRARASTIMRTVMAKVMQTVKMGTTVTSI